MSEQVLRQIRKDINEIIGEASKGRRNQTVSTKEVHQLELLEAAKAVVQEFLEMSGRIEETPLSIQRLKQAIAKAERST